ncbi:hypothetical protein AAD018_009810 [Aestuariibius insulae]|uniref:hypothetical protein n=1 Tax=Aestuariibius insulae TaxID=2058287 RepID=UPI003498CA30
MPDLPADHPDFAAAWLTEENAGPKPTRHDMDILGSACRLSEHSAVFRDYSDGHRNTLSKHFGKMAKRYGRVKITNLRKRHIAIDIARFEGHAVECPERLGDRFSRRRHPKKEPDGH